MYCQQISQSVSLDKHAEPGMPLSALIVNNPAAAAGCTQGTYCPCSLLLLQNFILNIGTPAIASRCHRVTSECMLHPVKLYMLFALRCLACP